MKKIIAILLTLVLCISLVACGTDNQENQKNTTAGVTDYKDILCNGIFWSPISGNSMRAWMEDGTIDSGGNVVGTWEIEGTTLNCAWKSGGISCFEIRMIDDICFLVGEEYSFIDPNARWDRIPTVSVEITMDNWQQYFEFVTETREEIMYDVFGEATGETKKYEEKFLKLKDEYFRALLSGRSELSLRYTYAGEQKETKLITTHPHNAVAVGYYGLENVENTGENSFEMLKIQGTLCFVDGLLEVK